MKFTTSNSKELTKVRALLHGDSGIGKTTSLRTLPEDRTLIAIGERGAIPLRKHSFRVLQIESWDDVREMIRMFHAGEATPGGVMLGTNGDSFECRNLAIDSLSELSELCKMQIVTIDRRHLIHERTKGKSETPAGVYDDQMTMEDWGLYRTRMIGMISAVCHLPVHVIVTCLSQWTEDKTTGAQLRTPNLSGKAANECPAYFDEVFHMESVKGADGEGTPVESRLWRTFNDGRVMAKDASGVLDPFEESNWTHIFTKILASNGSGKEK